MFSKKEYIYEIYKTGSFSRAAQNLYISQPSLSAIVMKTEKKLGMPLFHRSTHPISLTEAGKAYIEAVEKINSVEYDFKNKLLQISNAQIGHLTVGGANFFSSYMLPPIIMKFSQKYPAITFEIVESDSVELYDTAIESHLDLIIDAGEFNRNLFTSHNILTEQILLAVPLSNPINKNLLQNQYTYFDILANKHTPSDKPISLEAFRNERFILLKRGHDMHTRSIKICQSYGFEPENALYLNQLTTAFNLSAQNLGIVFTTDTLVKLAPMQPNLVYYTIDDVHAQRNIFLAHRKNALITNAMENFIQITREHFH